MEKGIDALLEIHPFFMGMSKEDLTTIAGCGQNVRFEPGAYISREGEDANDFYAIRSGVVALEVHVPHRGPVRIQTVHEGDVLGWSWIVPPYRWAFDSRAIEDTRCVKFDGTCLRGKFETDHALGYEMMKRFARIVARRLEAARLQLLDVYAAPAGA